MTHVKQAGEVSPIPLDEISNYGLCKVPPTPPDDTMGHLAINSAYKDADRQRAMKANERRVGHG